MILEERTTSEDGKNLMFMLFARVFRWADFSSFTATDGPILASGNFS